MILKSVCNSSLTTDQGQIVFKSRFFATAEEVEQVFLHIVFIGNLPRSKYRDLEEKPESRSCQCSWMVTCDRGVSRKGYQFHPRRACAAGVYWRVCQSVRSTTSDLTSRAINRSTTYSASKIREPALSVSELFLIGSNCVSGKLCYTHTYQVSSP